VAFFGAPGVSVSIGAPFVSWVALGWGEPCVPWWGRPGFVGHAWWGGWAGPRVVNNVVINRTTVVNVTNINVYRNVSVRNAVVAVRPDRFGRGPVSEGRIRQVDTRQLEPVHGAVDLKPDRASFAAASGRGVRPPDAVLGRPVVATRAPVTRALPHEAEGRGPAPRIVPAPRAAEIGHPASRPPFGQSQLERARPPRAPRFEGNATRPGAPAAPRQDQPVAPQGGRAAAPERRPEAARVPEPQRTPEAARPAEVPRAPAAPAQRPPEARAPQPTAPAPRGPAEAPRREAAPPAQPRAAQQPAPRPQAQPRVETPRQAPRQLPGEPANRLYPGRVERPSSRGPEPRPTAQPRPAERGGGNPERPAREGR